MRLSAALIVKNESSCLEQCLKSLKGFDEIVVVDTGSTDNTVNIARNLADKVYRDYKWNDNFAEARNHVLSKVTGDWVFSIDADEELLTGVDKIRDVIAKAEENHVKVIEVIQESRGGNTNYFPRLFKKDPEVYWCGAIHNYLSLKGQARSSIRLRYGYSAAHQLDPDRTLRILKKEVAKGDRIRELYYLAREYYYRKDYKKAITWWKKYVKVSRYLAEKADAYLYLARCYWALRKGEIARQNCLMAIEINANFEEALNFMAELSWEHNAVRWRDFAKMANNNRVLFVRGGKGKAQRILEKNINDAEHYNDYWAKKDFKIDNSEPLRTTFMMKYFRGGKFLDAGCGLSPYCEMASKFDNSEVHGLDVSNDLIEHLKKDFPNINYIVGDVNKLPFEDNYFDYITMAEVLEHMEAPKDTIREAIRALKPKGILALSVPNDDMGGYAKDWHLWSFNKRGIEELCGQFGEVEVTWMTENNHRFGHIICFITKK